jgi:hypothetical protein
MPIEEGATSSGAGKPGLVKLPRLREFVRQPFSSLLLSLILLFALGSVVTGVVGQVVLSLLQSAVLVSGVWSVAQRARVFVVALVLGVPTFALRWLLYVLPDQLVGLLYLLFSAAFFSVIAVAILTHVFRQRRVTMDTISGAACVYFFMGVIFADLFALAELLHPGSFVLAEHLKADMARTAHEGIGVLSYFSFVTLTTLGYGDISPATSVTRSLTTLEATLGQLYLTILVARLVGLHVAAGPPEPTADSE